MWNIFGSSQSPLCPNNIYKIVWLNLSLKQCSNYNRISKQAMREQNQQTQQVHQPLETAKKLLNYQLSTYQLSRQQLEEVKAKIRKELPAGFTTLDQRRVLNKIQRELQEIERRERGKEMDQRIKELVKLQQSSTKKQTQFENDLKQNSKISNLSFNFQKMLKGFQEFWLGSRGYQMESEDGSRKTLYQPNPRAAYQQQHQSLLSSFQSQTCAKTTQNKNQQQMTSSKKKYQ